MQFGARLRQERIQRHLSQEALAEALGVSPRSIARWEQDQALPQASVRLQLSRFFNLHPKEFFGDHEAPIPLKSLWGVPYPRNPFFTGREEILHHLHELLNREHTTALTQSWAISGLGGIGKTQIALEYAYQYRQDYRYIFWVSAATRESLFADIVTIVDQLQLPERNEQDQKKVVTAIKQWFASHQEWLLILDNADDITIVSDFVPTKRSGHMLLTTRAQALGALAQRIDVATMGMAEGTLFLLRRAKIVPPDMLLDQVEEETLAAAETIVTEMDFLPLALDQAGAYIEEVGCNLSTYLELYRTHRKELLQRRGHIPTDHPEPVATTWSLNFLKVEQANPGAADLLCLCAFLESDTISEELISGGGAQFGSTLQGIATNAFRLNEAIEELRKFSLIQRNSETQMLRIHRLVQVVLKDAMAVDAQRQWGEQVVRATNTVFPERIEIDTWPLCRRYLSQAQVCSGLIQDYAFTFAEAAALLYRTAIYLQMYALYEQAEPSYQQALNIYKQILEPDSLEIAAILNSLANLYQVQGKYKQAEPLYQQALHIREQALGPEHPDVANSLNGLALLYREWGEYEQAELLNQRAFRIQEQALGPEHPDVARSLNNLAMLFYDQGKFEQAMPLYQRALHIREQALGPEHPDTARALSNLALIYHEQGEYEQAETLYQRALRIREQVLGMEHPDIARALNNLAVLYFEQKKYEQAELFFQRALHIREQALGANHPDTTGPLNNLASLYVEQGKYTQAEMMYQQALRIFEQTLGPNSAGIAHPLHGLANIYRERKKYEQAELLYQRVLHIREQTLGLDHPDTAEMLRDLATLRETQGNNVEAVSLYQRVLDIQKQVLGQQHPKTVETHEHLRVLLQRMNG
ncbi:tetratricopeptide repeat protein [Ktedonobacter sp. SOSP1-85]|uniref:FxSxx-COOH system tetratricopeptide repeat protein n=1 Tax=Ktedonobacter sp. SOSP1-85 TaxID=2778367 RepID=UPI00191566B4|nr:FxSxx-COOH system tetratricopeptide repeat protein [Ktedonobacter sp. SOSP1-85]GHO78081.1 tetratricopeptide repeat protein [Ktedonobacter sp. SOSP1-85]